MEIFINPSIDGRPSASFVGFIDASTQDLRGLTQIFTVSLVMLDWIATYRDRLRAHSGPLMNFIEWLKRAVAMANGPSHVLALIDVILERGDLKDYYLAHPARTDWCKRLGKTVEAMASYQRAL
jgi:hypothetical protein